MDSDVIVMGELSGPGGTANSVVRVSARVYKIMLNVVSLQATISDAYKCSTTISPDSGVVNVTGVIYEYTYRISVGEFNQNKVVHMHDMAIAGI